MPYPPQPGRPKQKEFIESAQRYIHDDYLRLGMYGLYEWFWLMKRRDESIIRRERDADGKIPGSEDLMYYAMYQLARYRKTAQPES